MKPRRITLYPPLSWKRRATAYLFFLGGLWLFMEPLSAFGLAEDFLKTKGLIGYLALLGSSLILTIVTELFQRRRTLGKITFVSLTILLTEDGTEHLVEVPRSMRVGQFLNLFLPRVAIKALVPVMDMYAMKLYVRRNGQFQPVDSKDIILEAGLRNGDECKIKGEILPRHQTITLSARDPVPWDVLVYRIERGTRLSTSLVSWIKNPLQRPK